MLARFNRFCTVQYSTSSTSYFTKSELKEFLLKTRKVTPYRAEVIINIGKSLFQVPKEQLLTNVRILQLWKVPFKKTKPLAACLTQNPILLESKIALLKEFGIQNVSVSMISSLRHELYIPACIFKLKYDIPCNESICENMFNSLDNPPKHSCLKYPDERALLHHHHEFAQRQYLKWRLGSTTRISTKKLKSLRIIEKLLDIFLNVLCFEKSFILNRAYLLDMHPDKICHNLIRLKNLEIAGMPINAVIRKYPPILMLDIDNIEKLLHTMKKYRISDTAIWNCLYIFKLSNAEFIRRIERIISNPNLKVWSVHPRLLYAVWIGNLLNRRVHYLEKTNRIKSTSITTMTAPNYRFLRYMNNQLTQVWMIHLFSYIFREAFGISNDELTEQIKRHPNWRRISITDVQNSINYLKQHFHIADIQKSIHIILYPRDLIIQTLDFIQEKYGDNDQYNFTSAQTLMMCVYLLEKNTHFSGNGVWSTEPSKPHNPCLDHQPTDNSQLNNIKKKSKIGYIEPLNLSSLKDDDILLHEMMEDHWTDWHKDDVDFSHLS